ncbi:sulfatase-like hydrolase/transferase [Bariatricus sp. HCP28S3_D3]|uniref:sulfatase-like hydrolase/transferase n=1 Tax=Bariatricus sp. HCP28S3_D3 TaxID=3438901 RepID=UPI003F89BB43
MRSGVLVISGCTIYLMFVNFVGTGNGWVAWKDSVTYKGFMVCVVDDLMGSANPIIEPEGYEVAKITRTEISENRETENLPDIIVVLNESFCDLSYYTSLTTDVDYLEDFYSIKGAEYGYAITPNVGGGTNNSEFELLFSKSMNLLEGYAPFTYLERELEERSVVQYLEQIGYTTTGMHCGGEINYSRNSVYPAIGFDNIYLGPDAFSYISDNGNRSWLDVDNYNDLIDYYESANENPQFIYLLTFQNHVVTNRMRVL